MDKDTAFVHFGKILTREFHRNAASDKAMKGIFTIIGEIKFDESILKGYKPPEDSKLNLPDLPDEALAALLVVLYLKARDEVDLYPIDQLSDNIMAASVGYRDLLAKEQDLPNTLLKEVITLAENEPSFAETLKTGADDLQKIMPALRALGNNPWEFVCLVAGVPMAIAVCIVLGIALVAIFIATRRK